MRLVCLSLVMVILMGGGYETICKKKYDDMYSINVYNDSDSTFSYEGEAIIF